MHQDVTKNECITFQVFETVNDAQPSKIYNIWGWEDINFVVYNGAI